MDKIFELIPFLQKYPFHVKLSASITIIFFVITVILIIFYKPKPSPVSLPTTTIPKPLSTAPKAVTKLPTNKKPKKQAPMIEQHNSQGNNEANVNTGNNSGIIGGSNNTVINNYGRTQRNADPKLIDHLEQMFPDKNTHIRFMAFNGSDGEIENLKYQYINLLRKRGYNDIDENTNLKFGDLPPQSVVVGPNQIGGATFFIPPNR